MPLKALRGVDTSPWRAADGPDGLSAAVACGNGNRDVAATVDEDVDVNVDGNVRVDADAVLDEKAALTWGDLASAIGCSD